MIEIKEKHKCCGCNACVQICPKRCIATNEDEEGFLYPSVDKSVCIDCKLCEKVCPVINQAVARKPLKVYAAKNENEKVRFNSSSGGVFAALAKRIIEDEGIVFGASFNEKWDVEHIGVEHQDKILALQGSKYVQSKIGNSYIKAKSALKDGKKVLFVGTPCQIGGLYKFLRKEYANLITVDLVCHGVPSPKVWREYLEDWIEKEMKTITPEAKHDAFHLKNVSFRNKKHGWKNYSFALKLVEEKCSGLQNEFELCEDYKDNIFMRGFLNDVFLRPSCYHCCFKSFRSQSDITLGDLWGIENIVPQFDDDKGVTLVLINTIKGNELYLQIPKKELPIFYKDALRKNPVMEKSVSRNYKRCLFYSNKKDADLTKRIERAINLKFGDRVKNFIYTKTNSLINYLKK